MCLHKKIIILYDELSGNRIQGSQSSYRFTFPCPESVICNILYLLRRIKNDTPYRFCLWLLLNDTLLACGFPATHPEILLIESLPYILPYLRCYKNVTPSFISVPNSNPQNQSSNKHRSPVWFCGCATPPVLIIVNKAI